MDCIYCGIRQQMLLQDDAVDSDHIYEFVVCIYDNFVSKLFNSICQIYNIQKEVNNFQFSYPST